MSRADRNAEFQPSQLHHKGNLSPIRPRQKMPTIYRHRMEVQPEPPMQDSLRWPRDNSYLRKRLDQQVQQERSEMLMMSGRTSKNNPEWMTVNFDHYRKNGYMRPKRLSLIDERHYDVLNKPKKMFNGRNEDKYFLDHISAMDSVKNQAVFQTGSSFYSPINRSLMLKSDVTEKVGSLDRRDYTIRRPQLKIGSDSFVDTYSPF